MNQTLPEKKARGRVIYTRILAAAVFAATLAVNVSADVPVPDDQRASLPTIYEAAVLELTADNPNFSSLVELLLAAFPEDLEDIFDGETKYTVFGPTNDALTALVNSLTDDQVAALTDVSNGLLANLLLYHVAFGDWYRETFPTGALPMENGDFASVYWNGERLEIEGAAILGEAGETVLSNGIFHSLGAVMIPPGFLDKLNGEVAELVE